MAIITPRLPARALAAWLVLAVALVVLAPAVVFAPGSAEGASFAGNLIYSLQRDFRHRSLLRSFSGSNEVESDHFVVRYDGQDQAWAVPVLDAAEGARASVLQRLGWTPLAVAEAEAKADASGGSGKVTILLYPDYDSLGKQFGAQAGFRALGAYWGGVIQVQSPRLWLDARPPVDAVRQLWARGPFVHEYTHLILDRLIPGGNYPRWLSEGLAQYVEYMETGYLWLDQENQIRSPAASAGLYSLADLQRRFDSLDNMAMAYREAFLLVAYLEDVYGTGGVNSLLTGLASGLSFERALRDVAGQTLSQFEESWLGWLDRNAVRYSAQPREEGTPG